ncbi:hypothetical protein GCWU000325_00770 [Alloprevotella tannerae ATCC 51259]|uniref:Uncharacterized protein n=1 Tax=Alloprevotella tannerae ATCC 51259 TaxID=626522 RepID=C9LEY9_9BACT|nr:hypothetical protein GCWU000325_00770 [Alloprevotella tannerae ATCC 51259]
MSVHLCARDEKGLRSRWYKRLMRLGGGAVGAGATKFDSGNSESGSLVV